MIIIYIYTNNSGYNTNNSGYNTNNSGYIWLYDGIYILIYITGWWYMKASWDDDIPNMAMGQYLLIPFLMG